ncbi:hypothetical protein PR048_029266 [Dryococelus australis]|uniref:Uncharacterized protein n=1 Tax=Dryococelus australis TaxID=614101 RepID=A0ABQ9GCX0_9NEOP|nr:hypothetical protein PR048_029266 [Dryococelus australis]
MEERTARSALGPARCTARAWLAFDLVDVWFGEFQPAWSRIGLWCRRAVWLFVEWRYCPCSHYLSGTRLGVVCACEVLRCGSGVLMDLSPNSASCTMGWPSPAWPISQLHPYWCKAFRHKSQGCRRLAVDVCVQVWVPITATNTASLLTPPPGWRRFELQGIGCRNRVVLSGRGSRQADPTRSIPSVVALPFLPTGERNGWPSNIGEVSVQWSPRTPRSSPPLLHEAKGETPHLKWRKAPCAKLIGEAVASACCVHIILEAHTTLCVRKGPNVSQYEAGDAAGSSLSIVGEDLWPHEVNGEVFGQITDDPGAWTHLLLYSSAIPSFTGIGRLERGLACATQRLYPRCERRSGEWLDLGILLVATSCGTMLYSPRTSCMVDTTILQAVAISQFCRQTARDAIALMSGSRRAKWEILEKSSRPDQLHCPAHFSHAKIRGATLLGIEPSSLWWEANNLTTKPPWPPERQLKDGCSNTRLYYSPAESPRLYFEDHPSTAACHQMPLLIQSASHVLDPALATDVICRKRIYVTLTPSTTLAKMLWLTATYAQRTKLRGYKYHSMVRPYLVNARLWRDSPRWLAAAAGVGCGGVRGRCDLGYLEVVDQGKRGRSTRAAWQDALVSIGIQGLLMLGRDPLEGSDPSELTAAKDDEDPLNGWTQGPSDLFILKGYASLAAVEQGWQALALGHHSDEGAADCPKAYSAKLVACRTSEG